MSLESFMSLYLAANNKVFHRIVNSCCQKLANKVISLPDRTANSHYLFVFHFGAKIAVKLKELVMDSKSRSRRKG